MWRRGGPAEQAATRSKVAIAAPGIVDQEKLAAEIGGDRPEGIGGRELHAVLSGAVELVTPFAHTCAYECDVPTGGHALRQHLALEVVIVEVVKHAEKEDRIDRMGEVVVADVGLERRDPAILGCPLLESLEAVI